MRRLFETRSHSWREVGLARQLSRRAVRRARLEVVVLVPVVAGLAVVLAAVVVVLLASVPLAALLLDRR